MPAATYGVQNPGGTDPWPIESTLAPLATGGSSATAAMMLADYRAQREADTSNYQAAQQQQHKFAYDQLANQMAEAKLKALDPLLKTPGGAAFLQQGGLQGMGPSDLSTNPDAWTGLVDANNAANTALNLKNAGQGAQGLSNSGAEFTNTNQLIPSLNVAMGKNVQVQKAEIDAAGRLAAANAHAHGGGGSKDPKIPLMIRGGVDDEGKPIQSQMNIPAGMSDEGVTRLANIARRRQEMVNGPRTGIPGASAPDAPPPPGSGQATVRGSIAQSPNTSQTSTARVAPGSQYVTDAKIQGLSKQAFGALPPPAQADVRANVHGAIMPVVKLTDGTLGFKGASGQIHTVPAAGQQR